MNKFIILCSLILLLASCEKDRIKGSGAVTTEQRTVSDFTSVSTSGSTNVFITQGAAFKVEVKGYSNILPYLETKKENQTLLIAFKRNSNISNDNTEVYITMPSLVGVSTSGSGNIIVSGIFDETNMSASVSGSGNISIADGKTESYLIDISGSGTVKSFGFATQQANITINGSGDAEVQVAQSLKAHINGSGNIYYKGNPPTVDSKISGSGKLVKQ